MLIATSKDLFKQLGIPDREPFKAEPIVDSHFDTVTMYFEDTPSYAERVDSFLTLFRSFDDDSLVGFKLKGILRIMKNIKEGVCVRAETPQIRLSLVLNVHLGRNDQITNRAPYREVIDQTEQFKDAHVEVHCN